MLDDVTSRLAQHLADVAEAASSSAEELGSAGDVHRGVVRHSGDGELELADLVGDGVERLEMRLAPGGGGGHVRSSSRRRTSSWQAVLASCSASAITSSSDRSGLSWPSGTPTVRQACASSVRARW